MRRRRSARGKMHFVHTGDKKKTACGLSTENVSSTIYAELVSCQNCKWARVFWNRKYE